MARTFRNKNTLKAPGWSVRDDGVPYFGNNPWGWTTIQGPDGNYRRVRNKPPRYRRSQYRCERTEDRRIHNRTYRAKTNHLVRTGRWEDVLPPTRTSGWLSW